jgi:hypothetical protein
MLFHRKKERSAEKGRKLITVMEEPGGTGSPVRGKMTEARRE